MSHETQRWLEKAQVQAAGAAALAAGWFLAWPLLRPWDPHGALAFLPYGDLARFAAFAGVAWALAAGCAVLTVSGRFEGALLATLAGLAGLGLRSGPMAYLLWRPAAEHRMGRTFTLLAAETIAMAAVLVGAMVVITLVRAGAGRLVPKWAFSPRARPSGAEGTGGAWASAASNFGGCVVIETAVAVIVLAVTFRSSDPGQIAFALVVSFLAGGFIAHQTFPIRSVIPFWVAPLLLGVVVLALGGWSSGADGPGWYEALRVATGRPLRAALPVHWLGLGCGGAIAGVWISQRMRDVAGAARTVEPEPKPA